MLNSVDLSMKLDRASYKKKLIDHQLRLRALAHELYVQKRSLVVVVEGWDAAGKGGAIRRVTEKIDPRGYQVYAIAAPAGDDKTHHYLWRFWRRLRPPEDKQIVVFDRSWYGRVLVERVEGFATPEEWKRAYREINEFERQLTDKGIMLAKLWFHVSLEEQLARFEVRQGTPHKAWKLTEEDWRNREKWDQYVEAVEDMVLKTSTRTAPWSIIEGNDKLWARIRTQEVLIDAITTNLDPESPTKSDRPKKDKQKNG